MSAAAKSLVAQALDLAESEVTTREADVAAAEAGSDATILADRRADLSLAVSVLTAVRSADRSIFYLDD